MADGAEETYTHKRPSLWERLASLAGKSTYRVPVEGVGTKQGTIPPDHELCIALGWARRRDDPLDIGPDIAFDICTGSHRHKFRVTTTLARALSADGGRWQRVVRRSRPYLAIVAADAYVRAVHGEAHRYQIPDGMREDDWDVMTEAAYRVLVTMAEDAVSRAASRLRHES